MIIKDIRIENFQSLYGEHYFNFQELEGLIKLSGPIGSGKTSIANAILYGLFGTVKGINNTQLVSWNCKSCTVELNIISKNKEITIHRCSAEPLLILVNGKPLAASNKRDTQQILEEEVYDVPKLAITKMCVISFNAFNSLASMNPAETKQFLDEIFGFKLFSAFNNEVVIERKVQLNENLKLTALYEENLKQITYLEEKKANQKKELAETVDVDKQQSERNLLIEDGKLIKAQKDKCEEEYKTKYDELTSKISECAALGRQEKEFVNKFNSGKCPTCGHDIDSNLLQEHKDKMLQYATDYKKYDSERAELTKNHNPIIADYNKQIQDIKDKIHAIDSEIAIYNNNLQLINENYDELISEYQDKAKQVKEQLDKCDLEIGEWNEMNELFTKTLRYNLLETLIPHINKSIQYFINKLDQPYRVQYDQEFKPHIFIDTFEKEISYNNLSTGQKKSLDMAIIFGIIQNVMASINFNVYFLDELFSNLDSDARNIMLELLKESLAKDKCVFVVNHAEMNDDYFDHKIRVKLQNKTISTKKVDELVVKTSHYEKIF